MCSRCSRWTVAFLLAPQDEAGIISGWPAVFRPCNGFCHLQLTGNFVFSGFDDDAASRFWRRLWESRGDASGPLSPQPYCARVVTVTDWKYLSLSNQGRPIFCEPQCTAEINNELTAFAVSVRPQVCAWEHYSDASMSGSGGSVPWDPTVHPLEPAKRYLRPFIQNTLEVEELTGSLYVFKGSFVPKRTKAAST